MTVQLVPPPLGGSADRRSRLRPFSRSLPMSLLRARETAMRHFRPMLRTFDLTEQQWRVLRALSAAGRMDIGDLADATCLLGPSLSRILPDLEQRRLLVREAHPDDLRRSRISITRAGTALIERVTPSSEAIYAEITARFGAAKLAALQELLADLEAALGDQSGTADDQPSSR